MSKVELFRRRDGAARLAAAIVALSLVSFADIGWKSRAGALVLLAAGLAAETPKSAPNQSILSIAV